MALGTLDRAAVEALYARLERPLYNGVFRWLWDAEDAADVVQEAFVRLWRMRDEVDPARVEPLLWRIALNLAANRRRWRALRQFVGLEGRLDEAPDAPSQLEEARRAAALRRAVEALPEKLRRVIVLVELSGLTYAQVAEVLEIRPGTVGSRKSAAVARLRAALLEEGFDA